MKFVMGGCSGEWPQVESDAGELIARTYGPSASEHARLFAAAPAMLAALKVLLIGHKLNRYPLARDWSAAERAIDSAEGR